MIKSKVIYFCFYSYAKKVYYPIPFWVLLLISNNLLKSKFVYPEIDRIQIFPPNFLRRKVLHGENYTELQIKRLGFNF